MVNFDINGKVALITGGAAGLGFRFAVELLEAGARAVTLADIDAHVGKKSVETIEQKYGKGRALFVLCNVVDKNQFEDAFRKTVETFKNIDILINNAGILNDGLWEKEVAINVNGVIHGMLLGLDKYIPKYKSGDEGLIVNLSSVAGIHPYDFIPIYTGTKFAVHGMTLSWGQPTHYARTNVRVVAVCPGATDTALLQGISNRNLGPEYEKLKEEGVTKLPVQTSEQMGKRMIEVIKKAPNGTMWVVEANSVPFKFEIPDYTTMEREYLK